MTIRHKIIPGEYLFIGGPCDGERREVDNPYRIIQVKPLRPAPHVNFSLPPSVTAPIDTAAYRRHELAIHDDCSFFVYADVSYSMADIVKALIRRYRRES